MIHLSTIPLMFSFSVVVGTFLCFHSTLECKILNKTFFEVKALVLFSREWVVGSASCVIMASDDFSFLVQFIAMLISVIMSGTINYFLTLSKTNPKKWYWFSLTLGFQVMLSLLSTIFRNMNIFFWLSLIVGYNTCLFFWHHRSRRPKDFSGKSTLSLTSNLLLRLFLCLLVSSMAFMVSLELAKWLTSNMMMGGGGNLRRVQTVFDLSSSSLDGLFNLTPGSSSAPSSSWFQQLSDLNLYQTGPVVNIDGTAVSDLGSVSSMGSTETLTPPKMVDSESSYEVSSREVCTLSWYESFNQWLSTQTNPPIHSDFINTSSTGEIILSKPRMVDSGSFYEIESVNATQTTSLSRKT